MAKFRKGIQERRKGISNDHRNLAFQIPEFRILNFQKRDSEFRNGFSSDFRKSDFLKIQNVNPIPDFQLRFPVPVTNQSFQLKRPTKVSC